MNAAQYPLATRLKLNKANGAVVIDGTRCFPTRCAEYAVEGRPNQRFRYALNHGSSEPLHVGDPLPEGCIWARVEGKRGSAVAVFGFVRTVG